MQDFDPDKFFEEVFKAANKEYMQRNQAHKSPLDMQAVRSKIIFFNFSLTVKAAPNECVIRTGQP